MSRPIASHSTMKAMTAKPTRSTVARFAVRVSLVDCTPDAAVVTAPAAEPATAPAFGPARPAASVALDAT